MTLHRVLCLATGLLLSAPAHAVILWDAETAAAYGVERPSTWAPEADCQLEITSPTQATAGTTTTFDIYSISPAGGVTTPFAGVHATVFDSTYNVLHQFNLPSSLEDEEKNLPVKLTYSSPSPATHHVMLYQPESLDYYSYWDESTSTGHVIGMRWCEGLATVSWVPADNITTDRKVTGGGWLEPKRRMFSLVAQAKAGESTPRGQFNYVDTAANIRFRSTELLSLQVSGNTVYLQARGELEDGSTGTATVMATDTREPGTLDTLDVTIGYHHSASALSGGDIQVH